MIAQDIFQIDPFSLDKNSKSVLYARELNNLHTWHYHNCSSYSKLCDALNEINPVTPVRLFKNHELLSVPKHDIVKTMTSSGTTGQQVSKIFLSRDNASDQIKVLAKISADFLGKKRLPMLVIDSKSVVTNRNMFSARGAGILGFSMLGTDVTYALDDEMHLDIARVSSFLEKHKNEDIFIFGFTYIIWQHFVKELQQRGIKLPLENGIILHGGGWKKLIDEAVSSDVYKKEIELQTGIRRIYNYYGMVEQTGSIFIECQHGRFHASIYSDVIIRNPIDFSLCGHGEVGLVQLVSLLPTSYPGHNILSEDLGESIGEDDCPCGRLGRTFKIHGRLKQAEVRGCSDTVLGKLESEGKLEYLVGDGNVVNRPIQPYDNLVCEFLQDLSAKLITFRNYPDLISLAYWFRKANISRLKKSFPLEPVRIGRGLVFHITPSNVPVNFAFSFAFGLLAGNSNIVRVPSKPFPQTEIICSAIRETLEGNKYASIREATSFVTYPHDDAITTAFTNLAQARIIWGGDASIHSIRTIPLSPRGVEIAFADRKSICLLDSDAIMKLPPSDLDHLAHGFYNDTYLMDQNACSSPQLVVWCGTSVPTAQTKFWTALLEVAHKYNLQPIQAVDKYTDLCDLAINLDIIKKIHRHGNLLYRIELEKLPKDLDQLHGKFGMFYEWFNLDDLIPLLNPKIQTVSYFGVPKEQIQRFVLENNLLGIDRIVPTGQALDIGVYWDGYDLIGSLSRVLEVK